MSKINIILTTGTVVEYEILYPYAIIHSVALPPDAKPGNFSRSIRQFVKSVSRDRNVTEVAIAVDANEYSSKAERALTNIGFTFSDDTWTLDLHQYLTTKHPKVTIIGRDVLEISNVYNKVRGKSKTPPENVANVLVSLGEYLLDKDIPDTLRDSIERDLDDLTF